MVGTKQRRHFQPSGVLGGAGDNDLAGARLLADYRLRQTLLPGALDQHHVVITDIAIKKRPFNAIGHGGHQPCKLRRHAVRHLMHHGIPRQEGVLGKTAPQVRRLVRRCVAIADTVRVATPIGIFTMTVFPPMTPLAFETADVMFHKYQVAFPETLAPGKFPAGLGDITNIFVTHDDRAPCQGLFVHFDIGTANTRYLHLQQGAVFWNIRHRKFPNLNLARTDFYRCQNFFHMPTPIMICVLVEGFTASRLRPARRQHARRIRATSVACSCRSGRH